MTATQRLGQEAEVGVPGLGWVPRKGGGENSRSAMSADMVVSTYPSVLKFFPYTRKHRGRGPR